MFIKIAHAVEAETKLTYTFPGMNSVTVADPGAYVYTVFTFALGIVGLAALAFLVYGGIRYILSAGNPSALADAKDRMTAALIGVVLLLSSYLILNTIDPRLLQLTITDIKPAMPGNINFAAIDALVDEAIVLINSGDLVAVRALREEARKKGLNELRVFDRELTSKDPAAMAKFFNEELVSGEKRLLLLNALLNRQGAPEYNAQSEYNPSQLIQRTPIETLYGLYWTLPPDAQQELLGQSSDTQRVSLYWKFGESGGARQQESYMSQLSADHLARIYQNFQSDGVHGVQFARQIAKTSKGSSEASREVVGIWKRLRPGAERELFLKQVKQAGWSPSINTVTQANLRQVNPNASEVEIASEEQKFVAEWASQ